MSNLLDNAARHSPEEGVVEVTVDADGVRVRDHGSGIEEADLPYIFDRFYRGSTRAGVRAAGWAWRSCARPLSSTAAT